MISTQYVPKYDPPITEIAAAINNGKTVLLATDTIWSIVCDAFNKEAYNQLSVIKKKPKNSPLIILMSDIHMLKQYVADIHPKIETLLAYHTRPLTIVYNSPRNLPKHLLEADGSVAIRLVNKGICKAIMDHTAKPLATTSANIFREKTAIELEEIPETLKRNVDIVVDNNTEIPRKPETSVIAKFDEKGELEILRG